MKRILIITLTLFSTFQADACICGLEPIQTVRQRSIEQSDLIFTARVVLTDTVKVFFTLQVLRVYKGRIKGTVEASSVVDSLGARSTCGFWPSPYWGDEFIVYADWVKGTKRIYIDHCSATRSLSNPQIHLSYFADGLDELQDGTRRNERKLKQIANRDLKEELKILEKLTS